MIRERIIREDREAAPVGKRAACLGIVPAGKGPGGEIAYECFRYHRPCRAVETCPYKIGTTVTEFARNNI